MGSAGKRRVLLWAALGLAALALASVVVALLSVDAIASSIARGWLREQGLTCAPEPEVDLALDLGSAQVAPITCRAAQGPVATAALPEGASVALSGLRPERVSAPTLTLDLRARSVDAREDWLAALAGLARVRERMQRLVVDAAELSRRRWPGLAVARLAITREGQPLAELSDLQVESSTGRMVIRAQTLTFAEVGEARIAGLFAEITPGAAELSADVDAVVTVLFTQLRQRVRARVTATGLDTPTPRFRLGL